MTIGESSTDVFIDGPRIVVDAAGNATAVWLEINGSDSALRFSHHPVGGDWSASALLAPVGAIEGVQVAMAPDGLAIAVWSQIVEGHDVVHASTRTSGGSWSTPVPLSAADVNARNPAVTVAAGGAAVVTFVEGEGPMTLRAVVRADDGSWSEPDDVSVADDGEPSSASVAVTPDGVAVAAWEITDPTTGDTAVQAAVRPAGEGFGDPVPISDPEASEARDPRLAMNVSGVATVAWREEPEPPEMVILSRTRAADGSWSAEEPVSDDGANTDPALVVDPSGTTTAVWTRAHSLQQDLRYASRPAGGEWSAPEDLDPGTTGLQEAALAVNPDGRMAVAFEIPGSGGRDVGAMTRDPGGSWTGHGSVSEVPDGLDSSRGGLAIDDAGQVVVGWSVLVTDHSTVQVRALDTRGPLEGGISIPAKVTVGKPTPFAWPAVDAWSEVSAITWNFGDGSTRSGASVTKTYNSKGTFVVSVTATDAVGNTTTITRNVRVVPPVPKLKNVSLTEQTIHVIGSASLPRETRLKLTLNTRAKVKVVLKRTVNIGGQVVKATLTRTLEPGKRAIRLTSKIGTKRLPPGVYRVTVTARNAAGTSDPKVVRLTIRR